MSRESMALHQRSRVCAVAIETFARYGYKATTIDRIIADSRIGVGKFYELFEGKEDCFLACFDRVLAETRQELALIPAPLDWPERVGLGLNRLAGLAAARPSEARIVLVEAPTGGPQALHRWESMLEEVALFLRYGRSFRNGGPRLPETHELAIAGGLAWLFQQRLTGAAPIDDAGLLSEAVEFALEPYLPAEEISRLVNRIGLEN
jgi:AcrR family transcriptional regulator